MSLWDRTTSGQSRDSKLSKAEVGVVFRGVCFNRYARSFAGRERKRSRALQLKSQLQGVLSDRDRPILLVQQEVLDRLEFGRAVSDNHFRTWFGSGSAGPGLARNKSP